MTQKTNTKKKTELRELITKNQAYLKKAFLITIFSAMLPIAPIAYMRVVFGPVINSGSVEFLLWVSLILVMMLTLAGVLEWIRSRLFFAFTTAISGDLENRIINSAFTSKNMEDQQRGSTILQVQRTLRMFVTSPIMGAIFDSPISLIFLFIIYMIHPLMGLLALTGATLALVVALVTEKSVRPKLDDAMISARAARAELSESFKNIESAYASGIIKNNRDKWKKFHKKYLLEQAYASNSQNNGTSLTKVVMMIQGSLLLGLGTLLAITGVMDIRAMGNIIIAKFIGILAIRPFVQVIMGWKMVVEARQAFKNLEDFLEENPPQRQSMKLPPPKGKIDVSNLSYLGNENKNIILDNLNFKMPPGNILAVIGHSGAGKTSLARLLTGFYEPHKGYVRLDGVEIHTWSKADLSRSIGYLPQSYELFEGSIEDNISRFGELDQKALEKVIKLTDLESTLSKLHEGLKTLMDPDNIIFSRGEVQKICLARAFYGDPKYIILDEPTSNLDERSELKIVEALKILKNSGSSIVTMTHTKNIVANADFVLGLAEGRQKMYGSKEELKKKLLQ